MQVFNEKLIFLGENLVSQEDVFKFLTDKLFNKNLVKPEFFQKIVERERQFPTGLSINGFGVAIPHTDSIFVNKSQIAYVSLKEPVIFKEMGNSTTEIKVNQVFMLALKEAHEQLDILQKLIEMFQNEMHMTSLATATSSQEVESVLMESGLIIK